jgi:formamidopyrimidine-DNA glycosylase
MNQTLVGKTIKRGILGNSPHKFVWYNRTHQEFEKLIWNKLIGTARVHGRWLTLDLEPGFRLVLGECGGKILFHLPGVSLPEKYHLLLIFTDDSALTAMTTMWGAMELFETGKELERQYIKDMRTTPVEPGFTFSYFTALIDELLQDKKRSVKSLLTQNQIIPGLGNAIAQDIMFTAHLHPHKSLQDLTIEQRCSLFKAIKDTTFEAIEKGGRNDETDLFGNPGGYTRLMDNQAVDKPCSKCGSLVKKIQYLGGACYFCPSCQPD